MDKIKKVLEGKEENYILPFLWMHGEDEKTIREYMEAIYNSSIKAVCVESRPHPDYCGPKWWEDMDVILDEARKKDMKVWILDDSHFPTGYANGALKDAPEELCRQGVVYYKKDFSGLKNSINMNIDKILQKKSQMVSQIQKMVDKGKKKREFSEDVLLSVTAIRIDTKAKEKIDLTNQVQDGKLKWELPEGKWRISVCKLSRNLGAHREYMNMLSDESCRILLDEVYESHFEHYADDFGKTIAGFFSDEPELGNGALYMQENVLGTKQDLPWHESLEYILNKKLGKDWKNKLCYLWDNDLDKDAAAYVRYVYMDAVTRRVEEAFSKQVGNWCREHGVEYIGHVIEDNNQHARTGSSLGHYFRSLSGQDMAGIDDIGGQVLPGGEDEPKKFMQFMKRDGEFYHYVLGKLGSSLGALNPSMKGRTMCEIFGNYGWQEGFRLEKYLADHFMSKGVNRYVPHAFSMKEFPDPDCPPHFYAHGHNPQYRHFRYLMEYMNRVCELISDGRHISPVALLYHGEAEWTGECMFMQKPARKMLDNQIDFDIVPTDVFIDREMYNTDLNKGFKINTQEYKALVIPKAQYISHKLIEAILELRKNDIPVYFVEELSKGTYDNKSELLDEIQDIPVIKLDDLVKVLKENMINEVKINPENNRIRYYHYVNDKHIFYLINEGKNTYKGKVTLPNTGHVYSYNAWNNKIEKVNYKGTENATEIEAEIEPYKSLILVFGDKESKEELPLIEKAKDGEEIPWSGRWRRSICESISYPNFTDSKEISMPDNLADEKPDFSGFVKYENTFVSKEGQKAMLVITDAYEGIEVFVNNKSVGVEVVPVYRFDISDYLNEGENMIRIEVSTTLERKRAAGKQTMLEKMKANKQKAPTGITGEVYLLKI